MSKKAWAQNQKVQKLLLPKICKSLLRF